MNFRFKILKSFWTEGVCLPPTPGQYTCILLYYSKIYFSKTAWPIKVKFYRNHVYLGGTYVFINKPGPMTKMAAMPIYGKKSSKYSSQGLLNLLQRNLTCSNCENVNEGKNFKETGKWTEY